MLGGGGAGASELGGDHKMRLGTDHMSFLVMKPHFQTLITQALVLPSASRGPSSPTTLFSNRQMAVSYITATTTAVATAVSMNMMTKVPLWLLWAWWPQGGSKSLRENSSPGRGHFPSR